MSYKNAMAGLPLGGGKSVILANEERTKTPDQLHAFGKAVEELAGRYITAEDVGISVSDMIEIARSTKYVAGLPNSPGDVGGHPGPHTSLGVYPWHQSRRQMGLREGWFEGAAPRAPGCRPRSSPQCPPALKARG